MDEARVPALTTNRALAAGAALVLAASVAVVLLTGLIRNPFSISARVDDGCPPPSTLSTARGPGCPEVVNRPPATAFSGPDGTVDDPTTSGRITTRMLHTHDEIQRVFSDWPWGRTCWDEHAWNPSSDHPLGRACDFATGRLGRFPTAAQRTTGWQLARWAQVNADRLGIRYIIWDGQIWSGSRFRGGWRPYNGGGVYDPEDPTGGHFDHVHLSVLR